jgi:hypothetical protein
VRQELIFELWCRYALLALFAGRPSDVRVRPTWGGAIARTRVASAAPHSASSPVVRGSLDPGRWLRKLDSPEPPPVLKTRAAVMTARPRSPPRAPRRRSVRPPPPLSPLPHAPSVAGIPRVKIRPKHRCDDRDKLGVHQQAPTKPWSYRVRSSCHRCFFARPSVLFHTLTRRQILDGDRARAPLASAARRRAARNLTRSTPRVGKRQVGSRSTTLVQRGECA